MNQDPHPAGKDDQPAPAEKPVSEDAQKKAAEEREDEGGYQ